MAEITKYRDIERSSCPDWVGWVILDSLEANRNETDEHRMEIQVQLDYEYRLLKRG